MCSRPSLLARSLLLSLCTTACAAPAVAPASSRAPVVTEQPASAAREGAGPAEEVSVHPGINSNYFVETDIDPWAARFEREGREVFDQRAAILEALGLTPGMKVADIGAGTGLFTIAMARRVGASGRVYAVDLMPHFLAHIEAQAASAGLTQIVPVLALERSANLPPASVELVFTSDAYHHIEYPRAYLASIYEALQPGGALIVIDYERIEGVSDEWLLEHVRAGKDEVIAEIERAGFTLNQQVALLQENYFLKFRRA